MSVNSYRISAASGLARVTAHVGHLFQETAERWPIVELSQQPRPDPASRGLNSRYDIAELMCRNIAP
jgi:hypothetical protein